MNINLSLSEVQKFVGKGNYVPLFTEVVSDSRVIYAGAVGYFAFSGNTDFAIAIRTMVCQAGTVYAQAGAGIVYDSDPESEYEECLKKLMGSLGAVGMVVGRG